MSDKSRLCVQCGRYIPQDVLTTEDGPTHADGCASYDELVREFTHLREENERLRAIIEANDNYDQDATEAELERLRAALMAIRTRTGIKKDENGDLWGWRHPGDGNNLPIYELADKALEGSGE